MIKIIRYLFHFPTWKKLPKLPRTYSSEYDAPEADEATQTLMKLSQVRCPQGVEILVKRRGETPRELIESLPEQRYHRHVLYRLQWMICRAAGTTPYDPIKSYVRPNFEEVGYLNE